MKTGGVPRNLAELLVNGRREILCKAAHKGVHMPAVVTIDFRTHNLITPNH